MLLEHIHADKQMHFSIICSCQMKSFGLQRRWMQVYQDRSLHSPGDLNLCLPYLDPTRGAMPSPTPRAPMMRQASGLRKWYRPTYIMTRVNCSGPNSNSVGFPLRDIDTTSFASIANYGPLQEELNPLGSRNKNVEFPRPAAPLAIGGYDIQWPKDEPRSSPDVNDFATERGRNDRL